MVDPLGRGSLPAKLARDATTNRIGNFLSISTITVLVIAPIGRGDCLVSKNEAASAIVSVTEIGEAGSVAKFISVFDTPPNI